MYLLKESQHEKRPDACLTLRKLFWLGCPGVILPIDRKTFITRKSRLSCLSTRDVQQSAGCASRISWPGRAEDGSFRGRPEAAWAAPTLTVREGSRAVLDAAGHSCQGRASGLLCTCRRPRQTGAVTSWAAHAESAGCVLWSMPTRRADRLPPRSEEALLLNLLMGFYLYL